MLSLYEKYIQYILKSILVRGIWDAAQYNMFDIDDYMWNITR